MNNNLEKLLKSRTAVSVFLVILIAISLQSVVRSTATRISLNIDSNTEEMEESFTAFVSIPNGASAATISNILKNASLVDSAITFEIYIRNEGYADRLRAGNYEIESGLSYESLVNILLIGPPLKTYEITIVEGLWSSYQPEPENYAYAQNTETPIPQTQQYQQKFLGRRYRFPLNNLYERACDSISRTDECCQLVQIIRIRILFGLKNLNFLSHSANSHITNYNFFIIFSY